MELQEPYYMAGAFEHVAKMSRLPESPRMQPSVPPVRFRASVQPLTDLSDLPAVRTRPLTAKYKGNVPSSDSELDQEPHRKLSKDTMSSSQAMSEQESLKDSLQHSSNRERLRNKQRQMELLKEKENEALSTEQAERPRRHRDRRQRKTDWAQVQSEIEAVIDQPVSPKARQPSPAARRRQEARIQRWRKSGRVASADHPQDQKVGRNMRAAPVGRHSEPNSPGSRSDELRREHQIPGSYGILALDEGSPRLISYRPIDKELLHRMTQQTQALQRLGDAGRIRRGWESASQAESHSETPSMLERLLTEGTTNGLPALSNQRPISAQHTRGETSDRESRTHLSHRGHHSPPGEGSLKHQHHTQSPSPPTRGRKSHSRRKVKDKAGHHKTSGADSPQPQDRSSREHRWSSTGTPSPTHKRSGPDRRSSDHHRSSPSPDWSSSSTLKHGSPSPERSSATHKHGSPKHRRSSDQPSPTHARPTGGRRHSNASQQSSTRRGPTKAMTDRDREREEPASPAGAWGEAPSGGGDVDHAKQVLRGLSLEERAALARVLVRDLHAVGESEL